MLQTIQLLLGSLAVVLDTRGQNDIADYLSLANALLREGEDAAEELEALTAQIGVMVEENRGPTPEELEAVRSRREALSAQFDDIREKLSNEDEPE